MDRGEEEKAVATAKFISWSSRSRESSVEVKTGYSSREDESEEFDIVVV